MKRVRHAFKMTYMIKTKDMLGTSSHLFVCAECIETNEKGLLLFTVYS